MLHVLENPALQPINGSVAPSLPPGVLSCVVLEHGAREPVFDRDELRAIATLVEHGLIRPRSGDVTPSESVRLVVPA